MKKTLVTSVCALLLLSSCGTYTEQGAYTGATFGSIIGSAIGGIAGGPRGSDIGTLIGMAGGAIAGAAVGQAADNAQQQRYEDYQRARQQRSQGSQRSYDDSYYGGYAINTIRIAGVEHEFSSVPGVKEDVTNIILNLKQVRFKQVVEEFENEKVSITVENSTEFKAADIGKYLTGFEVLNPDLVICHLDSKASMQIDLTINKGRGYVPADENREFCTDVNVIAIDSIYTPIRNVKYIVEPYRVEQKTDYDKLVMEITTDGSIHPKDALKEAAKILIYHFMLFSDEKITLENSENETNQEFDEEILHMRQLLKTRLVDMNLSVRALNCLKAADVETLGDLVQYNKTDLLKFRNFGKKSLTELDDLLESLNLSFGTDISKYKLDRE